MFFELKTEIDPRGPSALLGGDPNRAVEILERVLAGAPSNLEARYWLASAKLTAGDPGAAAALEDARTRHALTEASARGVDIARCEADPAYAAAAADRFYAEKLVAVSAVIRRLALLKVKDLQGLLSYGLALQHQGRIEEACQVFQVAAETAPSAAVRQFLIFPQLFCEDGEARHSRAARDWAAPFASAPAPKAHTNPPLCGRKLRIGYVAPWFAENQLKQFIQPILENHDQDAVDVVLYPADARSETGWAPWIQVRPIGRLTDREAADLIREDRIDVLADCWGHAAGSRLTVFSQRPAPVQVAWINFVQTTGLEAIDYVLHADGAETAPDARLFTEEIWRIGPVFNAFRPARGRLGPSPAPASVRGEVTFGSFNHPAKLSGSALDAWGAILRRRPASRLLLKYGYFADPVLQRVTQARFAARGVAPERILFAGHSKGEAYFKSFQEVDLMLDAWPAPGSTTTLDALSNGVPVVVMAGPSVGGAYARSIMEGSGLKELIATSPAEFVERALELTSDLGRLEALRAGIRPAFDGGLYRQEIPFTRRLEAAFAAMFEGWRDRTGPAFEDRSCGPTGEGESR